MEHLIRADGSTFSGIHLPIRQGALFPGQPPPSIKFGKSIGTIKVSTFCGYADSSTDAIWLPSIYRTSTYKHRKRLGKLVNHSPLVLKLVSTGSVRMPISGRRKSRGPTPIPCMWRRKSEQKKRKNKQEESKASNKGRHSRERQCKVQTNGQ